MPIRFKTDHNVSAYDQFIEAHAKGKPAYLVTATRTVTVQKHTPAQARVAQARNRAKTITFGVSAHLQQNESVSNYALHALRDLRDAVRIEPSEEVCDKLIRVGGLIKRDYDQAVRQNKCPADKSAEIEKLFKELVLFATSEQLEEMQIQERIDKHREPSPDKIKKYKDVQLTAEVDKRFAKEFDQYKETDAFKRLSPTQQAIKKAEMREFFNEQVYNEKIKGNIDAGFYDPAVIHNEMTKLFKDIPLDPIPDDISAEPRVTGRSELDDFIAKEVEKYHGHLTPDQRHYIKSDMEDMTRLYLRAYPGKTPADAMRLARDLIRRIVYQERYDKGSLTGSDHGAQHAHGNWQFAKQLISQGPKQTDFNDKDLFMMGLVHMLHDIGYTTGLSSRSFECCKDHPFIGAAMIDAEKEYFDRFLDPESTHVLKYCIVNHAIAYPNLTPDAQLYGGMHMKLIRAVTSISDACALTFDRKTQEFWENPKALMTLARLKVFITDYPQYAGKFKAVGESLWTDSALDQNNPLDRQAEKIFKSVWDDLFKLASEYEMVGVDPADVEKRRQLFREAITHQFNTFTAHTTLGQYAARVTGLFSVPNPSQNVGEPKYKPGVDMTPSLMYGVLHDLFGADQANLSFKKLFDEFGGDIGAFAQQIEDTGRQFAHAPAHAHAHHAATVPVPVGCAMVNIHPEFAPPHHTKTADLHLRPHTHGRSHTLHLQKKQNTLKRVVEHIQAVYSSEVMPRKNKAHALGEFAKLRGAFTQQHLNDFFRNEIVAKISIQPADPAFLEITEIMTMLQDTAIYQPIIEADKIFADILKPLTDVLTVDPFTKIKPGIVKKYHEDLAQIRKILDKPDAKKELDKLNEEFIKSVKKGPPPIADVGLLERALSSVSLVLFAQGAPRYKIAAAERRFVTIQNILKTALASDSEYAFMFRVLEPGAKLTPQVLQRAKAEKADLIKKMMEDIGVR